MLTGDITQKDFYEPWQWSPRLWTIGIMFMSMHYEMEKRATLIDIRGILIFQK